MLFSRPRHLPNRADPPTPPPYFRAAEPFAEALLFDDRPLVSYMRISGFCILSKATFTVYASVIIKLNISCIQITGFFKSFDSLETCATQCNNHKPAVREYIDPQCPF